MDRVEELLRGELERLAGIPAQEPEPVLHRIGRQRRNRLVAAACAVLVLVGGATVAAAVLRARGPGVPVPAATLSPPSGAVPFDVHFLDREHGYALVKPCAGNAACTALLGQTGDGGVTWTWRTVTGAMVSSAEYANTLRLVVFDARRLVVGSGDPIGGWYTSDAGVTWSMLLPASGPTATVPRIPPGAVAYISLDRELRIAVIAPDGTTAYLERAPTGVSEGLISPEVPIAADGSAWFQAENETRPVVEFSRDRGGTWSPLPLPAALVALRSNRTQLVTYDGRTLYLVAFKAGRVWRTVDDGRHWQEITLSPAPTRQLNLLWTARPDGGLLVSDNTGKLYAVTRTGSVLREVPEDMPVVLIPWPTGARHVAMDSMNNPHTWYLSDDGQHWLPLRF